MVVYRLALGFNQAAGLVAFFQEYLISLKPFRAASKLLARWNP